MMTLYSVRNFERLHETSQRAIIPTIEIPKPGDQQPKAPHPPNDISHLTPASAGSLSCRSIHFCTPTIRAGFSGFIQTQPIIHVRSRTAPFVGSPRSSLTTTVCPKRPVSPGFRRRSIHGDHCAQFYGDVRRAYEYGVPFSDPIEPRRIQPAL